MHILVEIDNDMSERQLVDSAAASGVKVYAYSDYLWNKDTFNLPRIILGFGGLNSESIIDAVRLVGKAWISDQVDIL